MTFTTAAYQQTMDDASVVTRVPQPEKRWSTELPGHRTPGNLHTISLALNLSTRRH
jgi:hypothetical protein